MREVPMEAAQPARSLAVISVLEQTPTILEKLLLGATDDALHWKPSPERWSVSEVLAHLTETEAMFRERTRRMVEEESPALENYDQNAAYAAGKYSGRHAREQLKRFSDERDRSLAWLRHLPGSAAARAGRHAELGQITVAELMSEWAFHDLGHIRQIAELYRAHTFYPKMGGFQRYYSVKP